MSGARDFATDLRAIADAPPTAADVAVWVARVCDRLNRAADVIEAQERDERENTHLRLVVQQNHPNHCPYGHFKAERGCELGYPGCACMDDLLALQSWAPEDEERAAVRIGRLLFTTRAQLDDARALLEAAARHVKNGTRDTTLAAKMRQFAARPVSLAP